MELPPRFWIKINKDGPIPDRCPDRGRCWIWTAAQRNGYGHFTVQENKKSRQRYPHIMIWESLHGSYPKGFQIDHLCYNRLCVNPAHMEVVTQKVNILRGESGPAKNARKTHCPQGHPYSEENTIYVKTRPTWRKCRICQRRTQRAH